ncbi:type II secretion system secretin GspD [Luteimonas sp. SJ-92]|uniref:Type II secretion system secretin GspD n=1 Tax=Luteimonas salinisoli TaxID=2752307 RepID=A0A853JBI1_9GAMM|nr:type II secretion system secretin GspD [Luteimonas salinisoli]NZA26606.1 type II secretion system secretin GspD [Luteimonas salinisoli]
MKPRFAPWLIAAGLCLTAPAALPQDPPAAPAPALNVQNADIRAFIQDVARATGTTFLVDPRVQGTITLSNDAPLSEPELLGILVATLRANGLIAVPSGAGVYRVVPDDTAAQQPGAARGDGIGFSTEVFRLRHVDAQSAVETVKPLIGRGGVALATPQGNSLLVADYSDNLRRLRGLIAQIDQDRARVEAISLRNSSAREIAQVVNGLYGGQGRGSVLSVLPVESSNAVLLRGDPALVDTVRRVVEDLDRRAENSGDVRVIRLQHANAEELLPVLQQVVGLTGEAEARQGGGGSSSASSPLAASAMASMSNLAATLPRSDGTTGNGDAPLAASVAIAPGRRATIARYPGVNAIIINADPETQRMLVDVITQLDTRREQVLVEALVVEISDDAAKRLGAQLLLAGKDGNVPIGMSNFPGSAPGIAELAAAASRVRDGDTSSPLVSNALRSLLDYNGGLSGLAGETGSLVFGLIIDAVKSDTASNLLSTPSVLTLDNEEARILVGQEIPITTGEVLGDSNSNPFRTIQRQDVGIQLVVRPQINAGGGITLALRQEVSAIAGPVSENFDELILSKREIETRVLADDGAIVVLGGLLDQADRNTVDKVPVLGDIPGLGALFRRTARSRNKTNLMVFIRPTIVRDPREAQGITAPRYDYMRREQLRSGGAPGDGRAQLDALIEDYFGTTPPVAPPAPLPRTEPQPEPSTEPQP